MEIFKEIIFDIETGKETKIKFSEKELDEFEAKKVEAETLAAEVAAQAATVAEAKAAAEAKLATLGLTADDLKALLG